MTRMRATVCRFLAAMAYALKRWMRSQIFVHPPPPPEKNQTKRQTNRVGLRYHVVGKWMGLGRGWDDLVVWSRGVRRGGEGMRWGMGSVWRAFSRLVLADHAEYLLLHLLFNKFYEKNAIWENLKNLDFMRSFEWLNIPATTKATLWRLLPFHNIFYISADQIFT